MLVYTAMKSSPFRVANWLSIVHTPLEITFHYNFTVIEKIKRLVRCSHGCSCSCVIIQRLLRCCQSNVPDNQTSEGAWYWYC
jgi:hypothetical protein